MTYVPERLLPDEPQTIGTPEPVELGPPISEEERRKARERHKSGGGSRQERRCVECGGPQIENERRQERRCIKCGHRETHRSEEEMKRLARLRREHNKQSFFPKSVDEWYAERGGRA